jgi:predicted subunit of tRNA(5-methylaminomethyl-2-thiouridylate) methyltransferase
MSYRRLISEEIQEKVRRRAKYLCEYCHAAEQWQYVTFTVDHVIPLSKNGTDTLDNLALACFHCNRRKSNKITAIDPELKSEITLFNPRKQEWNEHFIWSSDKLKIIGLTPIGKITANTLLLNRERVINIRSADVLVGRHPPIDDPIQLLG